MTLDRTIDVSPFCPRSVPPVTTWLLQSNWLMNKSRRKVQQP